MSRTAFYHSLPAGLTGVYLDGLLQETWPDSNYTLEMATREAMATDGMRFVERVIFGAGRTALVFQTRSRNYPAVNGEVVTERDARVCAVRGHATHVVDGVDMGRCPRCGDSTQR